MDSRLEEIANKLHAARTNVQAIEPPSRTDALDDVSAAYAIQKHNADRRQRQGDQPIGRKLGLTSKAAQAMFNVDSADIGILWQSTRLQNDAVIDSSQLLYPRVEVELAFTLGQDLTDADISDAKLAAAVGSVTAALEIVDSRIIDWQVTLPDTVADNAGGWGLVCGTVERPLAEIDLVSITMQMHKNGTLVSEGSSSAVMGGPLNALRWAVGEALNLGQPLRRGEIILTGSLGAPVPAAPGDRFTASITGFPPVSVSFSA